MTEFNRFYWFVKNLRQGIVKAIGNLIRNHKLAAFVALIALLLFLFVGRSMYQPIFVLLRKYALLIAILVGALLWWFHRIKTRNVKGSIVPTVLLIAFVAVLRWIGEPIHKYCSLYFQYEVLDKVQLSSLGNTDFERIQPLQSIKTLVNQEALSETEDATNPKFIRGNDGRFYFSTAVGPAREYKIQQFQKNIYEVMHLPTNLPSPVFSKTYRDDVNFDVGELLLFGKNTKSAVIKRFGLWQFLTCETGEPMYLQDESNRWQQVVPILQWQGWIFPRPVFSGVFVIGEVTGDDSWMNRTLFGKGKFIPANEIPKHPFLAGQNLIPVEVANYIAESFRFSNGFFAPMPGYHDGDIRIPKNKGEEANQPFVTYFNLESGAKLYNYYGLEPFQEEKKGLNVSVFIPGDDMRKVFYISHLEGDQRYIGSSAISSKIIESRKNYDWTVNYPAETRPFIRNVDGKTRFFWLSTIVTRAGDKKGEYIGGSIPEITLTDAVYGKVVWINGDSLTNTDAWLRQASAELSSYWLDEKK